MISKKLQTIFLISIPVFIAHGLEEYFSGFYDADSFSQFFFHYLNALPTTQATFLLFQFMIWSLLIISFLLISNNKWPLRLMVIPGLVYFFEFHHIVKALLRFSYYPGLITGLLFPIIAFFFWKEFIKQFRCSVS